MSVTSVILCASVAKVVEAWSVISTVEAEVGSTFPTVAVASASVATSVDVNCSTIFEAVSWKMDDNNSKKRSQLFALYGDGYDR